MWAARRSRPAKRWATCRWRTCGCISPASRRRRASSRRAALGRAACSRLQPVLQAEALGEVDLGFQPVDVLFLALQDRGKEVPRNIVLHRFAMRDRLLQHGARGAFLLEVALERFEGVFAEEELAEVLEVRQPFEEENPLDEAIGVLHLVDRLLLL